MSSRKEGELQGASGIELLLNISSNFFSFRCLHCSEQKPVLVNSHSICRLLWDAKFDVIFWNHACSSFILCFVPGVALFHDLQGRKAEWKEIYGYIDQNWKLCLARRRNGTPNLIIKPLFPPESGPAGSSSSTPHAN